MYRYSKNQLLDFIIPSIILIGLMFLFHQTSLDEWVAGHFFSKADLWMYRDNFFLEKILHKGGVLFGVAILVGILFRLIYVWKKHGFELERDYLMFVLTSSVVTILFIFLLKRWTTLPCPWNAIVFGGGSEVPSLWKMLSSDFPRGNCFPAGHSSGGYAFLSMYYGHTLIYGQRKFKTLLPGLIIGVVFGITQQLRGAHFISHDFATILISIVISWVTYFIYSIYNKRYEN